jgi:membrane-bound ClpP family serine protease
VAQTELDPTGLVLVEGENWTARTDGDRIERGGEVVVTAVEGLKLRVTRKTPGGG